MEKSLEPFVSRLRWLAPLSSKDVSAVEQLDFERLQLERSEDMLTQGVVPTCFVVLLSGWAARYEVRMDGSRRITGILLPGDFCGIHAVCGAAFDHSINALATCELGTVPLPEMLSLVRASQSIFLAIWRAKLVEEATLRKWLVLSNDARQSVSHLLCEIYARSQIVGLASKGRCRWPLTQEDIGAALNLTAVHVNRTLRTLREANLIDYCRSEFQILDEAGLNAVARFDSFHLQPWVRS